MNLPPYTVIPSSNMSQSSSVTVLVNIAAVERAMNNVEFTGGFTERELSLGTSTRRGVHSIAARYAAKKAAERLTGISWDTFEVFRHTDEPPVLYNRESGASLVSQFALSLTHDEPFAGAYLVDLQRADPLEDPLLD